MFNEMWTVIKTATITLPAMEITVLLGLLSFCLIFKLTRIGLITAYLFIYRWGWIFFTEKDEKFLKFYLFFGTAIGIATVIGLVFHHQSQND